MSPCTGKNCALSPAQASAAADSTTKSPTLAICVLTTKVFGTDTTAPLLLWPAFSAVSAGIWRTVKAYSSYLIGASLTPAESNT